MKLFNKYSSEDEGSDAEMPTKPSGNSEESEQSADEMEEEEEEIEEEVKGEPGEMDTDNSETADEEEISAGSGHPYPTPPPDAIANMSLGNGVKKIHIENVKAKKEKQPKTKMASTKKLMPAEQVKSMKKESTISIAMSAIEALADRSGSSVQAIVKYIKSTDYEVADERRFSKLVLKALKAAVIKGDITQVKRSFKLSEAAKNKSKAMEKLKAKMEKKREKELEKEKQKKAEIKPKATAKVKTVKTKPSERKTKVCS